MSSYEQDVADRLERAADRMANAGFLQEELRYRHAARAIATGLSRQEIEDLEHELLLHPRARKLRHVSALAAAGEYDTGGSQDGEGGSVAAQTAQSEELSDNAVEGPASTVLPFGGPELFAPDMDSWSTTSSELDPFSAVSGGPPEPFSGLQNGDPFSQALGPVNGANPYTTGSNVDPWTGSETTHSFTGGEATTDSPPAAAFSMATLGFDDHPSSLLASSDLLAQRDPVANANVASDATSTGDVGQGSLQVKGESWAWRNFVDLPGTNTTYNVFSSPDGSQLALQPAEGGPVVIVDSTTLQVLGAQSPSGANVMHFDEPVEVIIPRSELGKATASPESLEKPTPESTAPGSPSPTAQEPGSDRSSTSVPKDQTSSPTVAGSTRGQAGPPAISEEQRDEENWQAARSGIWDTAVSMVETLSPTDNLLHAVGLPGTLDWAKSGRPTPTGDAARDAERFENYRAGGIVATVIAVASPIGAEGLLSSAELAASKLPALEGMGMMGGGRLIGPTEQWLSAFGEQALGSEVGSALPGIADQVPTGPSFEGVIDTAEFANDPAVIDRLSRARQFDLGEYESLTGRGEFGRPWDGLDVDEALQNAFIRYETGANRVSATTSPNPSMALPPELHRQIANLRIPQMQGTTAEQVLQFHIEQMYNVAPEYAVRALEAESLRFIRARGW